MHFIQFPIMNIMSKKVLIRIYLWLFFRNFQNFTNSQPQCWGKQIPIQMLENIFWFLLNGLNPECQVGFSKAQGFYMANKQSDEINVSLLQFLGKIRKTWEIFSLLSYWGYLQILLGKILIKMLLFTKEPYYITIKII